MLPNHDRRRYDNTQKYLEDLHKLKNDIIANQMDRDDDISLSMFKKIKDDDTSDVVYTVYNAFSTKLQILKTNQIKSNLLIIEALHNIIESYESLHKLSAYISECKAELETKMEDIRDKVDKKEDKQKEYTWKDIEFYKKHGMFILIVILILSYLYENSSGFRNLIRIGTDLHKTNLEYQHPNTNTSKSSNNTNKTVIQPNVHVEE